MDGENTFTWAAAKITIKKSDPEVKRTGEDTKKFEIDLGDEWYEI